MLPASAGWPRRLFIVARVPWSLVLVYDFTALPTDYGRKPGPPNHPIHNRWIGTVL